MNCNTRPSTNLVWSVICYHLVAYPRWLSVKNLLASVVDAALIPGWGRSSEEGNGNPLKYSCIVSSVQSLRRLRLFVTPWIAALQASLSITNSQSSLRLTSIESVMPSSHLILGHPLLLLPSIPPSISLFQWVNSSHEVAKVLELQFSIVPSKEIPGLISFRMDWLDLLAVQGTPKSLLQHHSSKASILWHSAFFTVQLSHPYMTTGKTIALSRWTLVGKVMSLLLNMLSRLVITFLPRSKCLLISWLQSPSAVILEPQKKSDTVLSSIAWKIPWTEEVGRFPK